MTSAFQSLCYHYIRQESDDPLPRIFGTKINNFIDHVKMIQKKYNIISLDEIDSIYKNKNRLTNEKNGLFFTFDDGLADQFEAAKILCENGISGVFFIPTCTLIDKLPANPIILHYAIAIHGLDKFLTELKTYFEKHNVSEKSFFTQQISKTKKFQTIDKIKVILYYKINHSLSRKILLDIYENLILSEKISNSDMHFSINQVKKLLDMGHKIGTHSHSHISIGSSKLSKPEFQIEMIKPKELLEKTFQTEVISMSYPFGERKDCYDSGKLLAKTKSYKFAFTIEHKLNTINTLPLEIGRYMLHSSDDASKLDKILEMKDRI